jgi:hypothetical protein
MRRGGDVARRCARRARAAGHTHVAHIFDQNVGEATLLNVSGANMSAPTAPSFDEPP